METYKVVFEYTKTYKGKIFEDMSKITTDKIICIFLSPIQKSFQALEATASPPSQREITKQLGYALYCIDIFLWLHIGLNGLKWRTVFPIILELSTCSFCSLELSTEGLSAINLVCWLCIGDREILWMFAASKTLFMKVSEFSEIISEHCLFLGVKLEYWSSEWILLEDSSGGFSNSKKRTFQNITISASSINDFCGSSKSITPKRHEMRIIKIPSIR